MNLHIIALQKTIGNTCSSTFFQSFRLPIFIFLSFFFITKGFTQVETDKENPYFKKVNHTETKWYLEMQKERPNVLVAQKYFQDYFSAHPKELSKQYKLFLRWVESAQLNIDEEGYEVKPVLRRYEEIQPKQHQASARASSGSWRMLGPNQELKTRCGGESSFMSGGYVDRVYINPYNTQNMFAGFSYGGLWVSQDQGKSWKLTDGEFPNGTNNYANNDRYYGEIETSKANPSIAYAATEAGLLRSTNKGASWKYCNQLNRKETINTRPYFIAVSPTNANVLVSTFGRKVYRSTDGGTTWRLAFDNSNGGKNRLFRNQHRRSAYGFKDRPYNFFGLEVDYANPNDYYLGVMNANNEPCIYKSTNGGASFSLLINLNSTNNVTMPTDLKIQTVASSGGKFYVYPEWHGNGTIYTYDRNGQKVQEKPLNTNSQAGDIDWNNPNIIYNGYYAKSAIEKSTDGGATFTDMMKGSYGACPDGNKYVHPDVRAIDAIGNIILIGTDGGMSLSTDGMLTAKTIGDEISAVDLWGFSSSLKSDICVAGMDHGPSTIRRFDGVGGWKERGGGDAIHASVNHAHDRWVYYDTQFGVYKEYVNEDGSLTGRTRIAPPFKVNRIEFHPNIYNIAFGINGKNLHRALDNFNSYELVHTFSHNINKFKISKYNANVMYVLLSNRTLHKSIDGGKTWSNTSPAESEVYINLELGGSPDEVFLAIGNNQNSKKVIHSTDGGLTWTNITTSNLPTTAVSDMAYQQGTNGGLYLVFAGMNGVWYKNNQLSTWREIGNGLPMFGYVRNAFTVPNKGKFRMGSSRGAWEHNLYETSKPIAQFSVASNKITCSSQTVEFIENSVFQPGNVSFRWAFEGGTPNSSTEKNPAVSYSTPGKYDVSLVITDKNGQKSTKLLKDFIEITDECNNNILVAIQDDFACENTIPKGANIVMNKKVLVKDFSLESGTVFHVNLNPTSQCYNTTAKLSAIINTEKSTIKVIEYNHFSSSIFDAITGNNTDSIASRKTSFSKISFTIRDKKLYLHHLSSACNAAALVWIAPSCWTSICENAIPQSQNISTGQEVLITDFASETEKTFLANLNSFANCYKATANLTALIDITNQRIRVIDYFHFNSQNVSIMTGDGTSKITSLDASFGKIEYRLVGTKLYFKIVSVACGIFGRSTASCWIPMNNSCSLVGLSCDDGDDCTINDAYNADCNCKGTIQDSDNDGICDANDTSNGDCTLNATCDDGDECTVNDKYDANCNCKGTIQDSDNDGICDANDTSNGDCTLNATCDDGDDCTINDKYDADCNCIGTIQDSDNDGICDVKDLNCTNTPIKVNEITLCAGNTTLSPSIGDSFKWSNNLGTGSSATVSPTSNASYSVSITDELANNAFDANAFDFINSTPSNGISANLFNGLDDSGSNSFHAFREQNGKDWGIAYSFGRKYSISNISINRRNECCTERGEGGVMQIWNNGIKVYQSNPISGDGNDIIAVSPSPNNIAGDEVRYIFLNGANTANNDNTLNFTEWIIEGTNSCPITEEFNITKKTTCDDGDDCTINDTYDEDCNCKGTIQDNDNDGICDAEDLDCTNTPIKVNEITLCAGNTTLSPSIGDSFKWSNNLGTGSSATVSPTSNASYSVSITDELANNAFDANAFDFINSTPSNGISANLFNGLDDSGSNSFHAFREQNGKDWGIAYSFGRKYSISNISINRRNECCTERGEGGVMQIWNNGIKVYQSNPISGDGNDIIAVSPSPNNIAGDEVRYIFLNGANTANNDNTLNFTEWIIEGTNSCPITEEFNLTKKTTCDDGDDCTINDKYDADCNCKGTFQDSDNDGVCDADDSSNGDCTLNATCDDGDDCTINDKYDADCNCKGTFQDSDNDGVCDADDTSNGDCTLNATCDDGDDCTINDKYDADCNCKGTFQDSDNDGVCDADDSSNGDCTLNATCDDGDDCTINDKYDADCNCKGTFQDSDNDGVCDADDSSNGDCTLNATCDDGDDCTINDKYDADCNCKGTFQDSDNDGVCDADDSSNGDCTLNATCDDGDDCTINDKYDADCNCKGTFQDSDNDGVCDADDSSNGDCTLNATCDDGDECTVNDKYDANCNCKGTIQDSDNDGICDANDTSNGDCTLNATCDDGDDCTINDKYDADCNCIGTIQDSDNDGICDVKDLNCTNTPIKVNEITLCAGNTTLSPSIGDSFKWSNNLGTGSSATVSPTSNASYSVSITDELANNAFDTTAFDFINSTLSNGIPANLFNGLDDSGSNSFHAFREQNGKDWGIAYSFGRKYSISNISINRRNECCTERGEGGVMQIWNNGIKVYQSNPISGDGNDIIAVSPSPNNIAGDEVRYIFLNGVNTANNDNTLNFTEWIIEGTNSCPITEEFNITKKTTCDDGDDCTVNDTYDEECNCKGTYQDTDNDGICDVKDLNCTNTPIKVNEITLCAGNTTLSPSIGDSFKWSNNLGTGDSATVSPTSNASYSVSITDELANNAFDTTAFDFINSTPSKGIPANLFNGLDDFRGDSFHATRKENGKDWGIAYSFGRKYSISNISINRRNECCTERGEGGVMQIWNNGVKVYQSNPISGDGDGNIAVSPSPNNLAGDEVRYIFLDGVNTANNDNILNFTEWIIEGTNSCPITEEFNITKKTTCDDGDDCTVNDTYDEDCNCKGTFQDSDNDGVCDAEDTSNGDCTVNATCDDGDDCTINDKYDADCNCKGTYQDTDNDGICDADDSSNGDCTLNATCDDGDDCTINDKYDADCNCKGTYQDSDNDGICDADDTSNGDCTLNATCDDGDDCTINDKYDADCNCIGTYQDSDNDGVCDADDSSNGDCTVNATCDDGDDCTINDKYDEDCNCKGTFQDSDNDGVCDADDTSNGDCTLNATCDDGDDCTINDKYDEDCNCKGTYQDSDNDGVCDADDSSNGDCTLNTTCDDGDDCTVNDTYDEECNCKGTFQDSDNDGICDADDMSNGDCTINATCDDGNENTINDKYDENCNCKGELEDTTNQQNSIECGEININYGNGIISMIGDTTKAYYFQIFDENWTTIYSCSWQCGHKKEINDLPTGFYRIVIKNDSWQNICHQIIELSENETTNDVDKDRDGYLSNEDCNDNDANLTAIGNNCDDGDVNTRNDKMQDDCTCAGEVITSELSSITCDEVLIQYGNGSIIIKGGSEQEYFFNIFDDNWNTISSCGWQCGYQKEENNLPIGKYRVLVRNTAWEVICNNIIELHGSNEPEGNEGEKENTEAQTKDCGDITISYHADSIIMRGIEGSQYYFKINDLDNGWRTVYGCNWNCGYEKATFNLPNSRYLVTIYNDDWSAHCNTEIELTGSSTQEQDASNRSLAQLEFSAYKAQRNVDLEWLTNTGFKVNNFEVERSTDGINFQTISHINNREWTETLAFHKTEDQQPEKGLNYYRIKQNYLDGSFDYTSVQTIQFNIDLEEISVFPNPAQGELFLNLKTFAGQKGNIQLLNQYGQIIQNVNLDKIPSTLVKLNTNELQNGLYFLYIKLPNLSVFSKKIMIHRNY